MKIKDSEFANTSQMKMPPKIAEKLREIDEKIKNTIKMEQLR